MVRLRVIGMDRREVIVQADSYDPAALLDLLNDDQVRMIQIGDAIFERTDVRRVIPIHDETTQ